MQVEEEEQGTQRNRGLQAAEGNAERKVAGKGNADAGREKSYRWLRRRARKDRDVGNLGMEANGGRDELGRKKGAATSKEEDRARAATGIQGGRDKELGR